MQKAFLFVGLLISAQFLIFSDAVLAKEKDLDPSVDPANLWWVTKHQINRTSYESEINDKLYGKIGGAHASRLLGRFDLWKKENSNAKKSWTGMQLNCEEKKVSFSYEVSNGVVSAETFDISNVKDSDLALGLKDCCYIHDEYKVKHKMKKVCTKYVNELGGFVEGASRSVGNQKVESAK